MQEQFFQSALVSREDLLKVSQRHNAPSQRRFVVQYSLFILSALALTAGPIPGILGTSLFLLSFVLFGVLVTSMFAIVHESMHGTAFASRGWNMTCNILAGAPIFYTSVGFQTFHAAHHRHTNHPTLDPERAIGGRTAPLPLSDGWVYAGFLSGLPVVLYKIGVLVLGAVGWSPSAVVRLLPYLPNHRLGTFRLQCRLVLLFHALWWWVAESWGGGVGWILLAQWFGHAVQSVYLMAEHNGLPMGEGTIVERTRSLVTPRWWRWVMWNMPYHAEHHAWPAVPWHQLPALHDLVHAELPEKSDSVGSFHKRALRGFIGRR